MAYRVVDLGTKHGGALDEFRAVGHEFFGDAARGVPPGDCLGVDLKADYRRRVEAKGYRFDAFDVVREPGRVPPADFVLLWDFLEHLPDVDAASATLRVALDRARVGVWLRMPSFEQDEGGEAPLRRLGLRFAWTRWHGHPTAYLVEHARSVLLAHPRVDRFKVKPGARVETTDDPRVVPEGAPVDTVRYSEGLGPKPAHRLAVPLVIQWEVLAWLKP